MRLLSPVVLIGFPLLDLALLVPAAHRMGWWLAVWLCLSAVTGLALVREARLNMIRQLAGAFNQGGASLAALMDSGRTLVAGLLFIFPGFLSDLLAVIILLTAPPAMAYPAAGGMRTVDGRFRRE